MSDLLLNMVVWSASHYYVPPPPVTICHRAAAQCPGSVSGGVTSVTILHINYLCLSQQDIREAFIKKNHFLIDIRQKTIAKIA